MAAPAAYGGRVNPAQGAGGQRRHALQLLAQRPEVLRPVPPPAALQGGPSTPGPSTPRSSRSSRRHAVAPRWVWRPQRYTGSGGPARKTAIGSRHRLPPQAFGYIQGSSPFGSHGPLSDQFPVRVCSCALCIWTVCVNTGSQCRLPPQAPKYFQEGSPSASTSHSRISSLCVCACVLFVY